MKVSVSFLSSKDKAKDLKKLNLTDLDFIHVDFMDGKFVPNKTLSYGQLKKIYKYTSKRLDVHLMCVNPSKYVKKFASLNTEYITFHLEIKEDINKVIDLIHMYGIKAGIAIKPGTDISVLSELLNKLDLILVMGVEPGMGGQTFIKEMGARVSTIKNMIKEKGASTLVSVDGGINAETKDLVRDADIIVSGSYVTSSSSFQDMITSLR